MLFDPPSSTVTSSRRRQGFGPRSTKATHWPWFLNMEPKFFHPPFLQSAVDPGTLGASMT